MKLYNGHTRTKKEVKWTCKDIQRKTTYKNMHDGIGGK